MTYLGIKELTELNLTTIVDAIFTDIEFYGNNEIADEDIGFMDIVVSDNYINLSFYIWDDYKEEMVYFENEAYQIDESDEIFIKDLLSDIEILEKQHPSRVNRE